MKEQEARRLADIVVAAREWRRTLSLSEREHFDAAAALRDAIDLAPTSPPAEPTR